MNIVRTPLVSPAPPPPGSEARDSSALPAAGAGPVVLYDGDCGLCDRTVQFVVKNDRKGSFRFAPLQGRFAISALTRQRVNIGVRFDSIGLLESPGTQAERLRVRSDAVLAIVAGLGGWWRLVSVFRAVPRPCRDLLYDLVALIRYRVFGKLNRCAIPSKSVGSGRFLD